MGQEVGEWQIKCEYRRKRERVKPQRDESVFNQMAIGCLLLNNFRLLSYIIFLLPIFASPPFLSSFLILILLTTQTSTFIAIFYHG